MKLLNDGEAAAQIGVSPRTMKRWRYQNTGPTWIRAGLKVIRYRQTDIEAWLTARTMASRVAA